MTTPTNQWPSETPDFAAIRSAVAAKQPGADAELWRSLFSLPAWFFINGAAQGSPPEPTGGQNDNGRFVLIFTDAEHAARFVMSRPEAIRGDSSSPDRIFSLPPEQAIPACYSFMSQGLTRLEFNAASDGFGAPIGVLIPAWCQYRGETPEQAARRFGIDLFELLAHRAASSRDPAHLTQLHQMAYALDLWIFFPDDTRADTPQVIKLQDGQVALPIFTSQQHAARAAHAMKLVQPGGTLNLINIVPAQARRSLADLPRQGVKLAVFNIASQGFPLRLDDPAFAAV